MSAWAPVQQRRLSWSWKKGWRVQPRSPGINLCWRHEHHHHPQQQPPKLASCIATCMPLLAVGSSLHWVSLILASNTTKGLPSIWGCLVIMIGLCTWQICSSVWPDIISFVRQSSDHTHTHQHLSSFRCQPFCMQYVPLMVDCFSHKQTPAVRSPLTLPVPPRYHNNSKCCQQHHHYAASLKGQDGYAITHDRQGGGGGGRVTCASLASSLYLCRANTWCPLTHRDAPGSGAFSKQHMPL